ncbi:CHAT domain-containing protein [Bradyrhizobium sp. CB82]|uniref:CHAT domain-containing protein n=1 Tax=Bradyrhizobium sp. CB82 TaxID=3039159 RepID=UPI0024B1E428|nr:CHAT domain-containing protein [Bradyrhizobium sp. CB82]WFU40790.1 CHAT domain-containing protein [Bradyrhizobium sp. CB82]
MSVDLSKTLLWFPLELADDGAGSLMQLKYAIGRTVSADVLVQAKPPRSSRLRVAVFAPRLREMVGEQIETDLPNASVEAKAVADAARSWGAEVVLVRPEATKEEVLEAICCSHFFHYAGHAEFLPDAAEASYLPILDDRITAEEVAAALKAKPHNLVLAFINGCGTSREATWERGAQVYGFASAFVTNATYFIGAQWPIGDDFAAGFASAFYARLFPPSYDLWWRIVRRNRLEGVPFAEALRLARLHLKEMGPRATQTWSSYVFYGDPTRRLVLE